MSDSGAIARLKAALEGRYVLQRELGEGGMATVYLAEDLRHERLVAVKVLKPELAAVVGAERFLAEIKTTANLQHPHILPLHDSGEAGKFLFYVMPYVEGESLRDRLDKEHQLAVQDALNITQKVAGALDYAHNEGVVHRDIKPGNILLSKQGEPLVADFGIALAVAQAGGGRITETGLSLGTPHYMSPEQATGDQIVGRATDTYALACVLYEMLVGEPPYTGSTAQAVLGKIIAGKVASATEQRAAVPAHVDAAIKKALEKLSADRFTSARAFASALTDVGFTHGVETTAAAAAPSQGPWNRLTVAMTGLATALAVGLGVTALTLARPEAPELVTRFVIPAPEGVSIGGLCCSSAVALSPDGEWLAFTGTGFGPIQRRRRGQLDAEPVPGSDGGLMPFFSPDSRWLGFYADGRIRKVPMTGGPSSPVAEIDIPAGMSWGDNDIIVFVDNVTGTLHTVPGAGGVPTPVPPPSDGAQYHGPWMLPGGEATLTRVRSPSVDEVLIAVVDLATGVSDTLGFGTAIAYSSGHLVFSGADGTLQVQPFDPESRRTLGPFVSILDGIGTSGPGAGQFGVSADGGLAYQRGAAEGLESLAISSLVGSDAVPLTESGNLEDPTFSPTDGRRIAMRFVNLGNSEDIWIWDRDQLTLERLTIEGDRNTGPVWSPDGTRIAYASLREDNPFQIFWKAADFSGPAEQLVVTDHPTRPVSWSPDGTTLALIGNPNGSWDVGLLTLGDSVPRWIAATEFNEQHAQISPDGRWLAYSSDLSGQLEVYLQEMSGGGGRTTISSDGGHSPRWGPGGDVLYYVRGEAAITGTVVAATISVEGGLRVLEREERFPINDLNLIGGGVNYDVSPDGQEFVHISFGGTGARDLVWVLNWPEIVREMTSVR